MTKSIFSTITSAYSNVIDIISQSDNILEFDFLGTDYRVEVKRLITGDIKVYLRVYNHGVEQFFLVNAIVMRPNLKLEHIDEWLLEQVHQCNALELATWFAGIPVVASTASTASTSDRTQTALTGNVTHKCNSASCDNRAMYVVKIGLDSEFSQVYYACDSEDCNMLEWLKVASADEINTVVYLDAF